MLDGISVGISVGIGGISGGYLLMSIAVTMNRGIAMNRGKASSMHDVSEQQCEGAVSSMHDVSKQRWEGAASSMHDTREVNFSGYQWGIPSRTYALVVGRLLSGRNLAVNTGKFCSDKQERRSLDAKIHA
jgi:hypothetical protein